jgi:kynurenine 3-monooxygenase
MSQDRVAIAGAGLAGCLLTLALAQRGYCVDVYERNGDPRKNSTSLGRSINLGLSRRGMQALRAVGLLETVLERAVIMAGRVIHAPDGSTRNQPYGKNAGEVLYSIDRGELARLLLDRAEQFPGVELHFGHRLIGADTVRREIELQTDDGCLRVAPKWVVGADGAFSNMRPQLQKGIRADFHREYLDWGYKEMTLPAGPDGRSVIELHALHVWPRGNSLFVSHPNLNGSHSLTLFLPFEGEHSFETIRTCDDFGGLLATCFPDLTEWLPHLQEQWLQHPVGTLVTTRTTPWAFGDWAVLIGDACHAVYPFYGQGMNCAFEDCCVLLDELEKSGGDTSTAFRAFERARRAHTDVLCELSKLNFIELRQKVRSPWFVARKRLDVALNRLLPETWMPLYTMVAHSTIPYGQALSRARRQDRILFGSVAGAAAALCIAAALLARGRW